MTELNHTLLHRLHRERGAKMVEFAGWEMPLNYGSQIEEHHCVRRAAGMFDVSHMLAIDLRGGEARDFLRILLANDVAKLDRSGMALYSCMLNETGGVLDDLIVYFLAEERFRLVVNAGTAQADVAWIESWRARIAPALEVRPRRDLAIIAVQGPAARERLWQAKPTLRSAGEPLAPFHAVELGDMLIARTGYTGEDGCEIMLPGVAAVELWSALERAQVAPAGLGARDTLRLEAGMNLYGQDMDGTTTPFECGLGWTVDLAPNRPFIGHAALAVPPVRRQLGAVLLDRGVMRTHQTVRSAAGQGMITSGGFAPTLNRSIALVRLPAAATLGSVVEVEVRAKWLKAQTVKPPFVRRGKVLVSVEG
jgi:aminomethyltransferase